MKTLKLDPVTWDLTVDAFGNIAVADRPLAIAQDVASACRLFLGELWYDTTQGLPYWESILGKTPSSGFLMAKFAEAALTVPGVVDVIVSLDPLTTSRVLTGSITITDDRGVTTVQGIGDFWYATGVFPPQPRVAPAPDLPPFVFDDEGNILLDDEGNPILA